MNQVKTLTKIFIDVKIFLKYIHTHNPINLQNLDKDVEQCTTKQKTFTQHF